MSRSARLTVAVIALLLCVEAPAAAAPNTTAEPSFVTNGQVHEVLRTPDRTFLGGDFDYIGPPTGSGVVMNFGGAVDTDFPVINGPVTASTSDGSGGYFIGGEFTRVGNSDRDGLAHILPDGTVDPNFNPDVTYTSTQDAIRSVSRSGSDLFIAGSFSHINGTAQGNVAKLATATGALVTAFDPIVGTVNVVLASNGKVYLGGTFTTVNSTSRLRLAAINPTTGDLDTGFVANIDSTETSKSVEALINRNSDLYVSGSFETVNGTARPGVAKVNENTGVLDTGFNAGRTRIRTYPALAVNNTKLFVGDRDQVHSFDQTTGARDAAFAVVLDGADFASADTMVLSGSNLLIGGDFTRVNDSTRLRFASVDADDGQVNNQFVQTFSHAPVTMTAEITTRPFVGGEFTSAGGVERRSVAALDASGDVDPGFENNRFSGFDLNEPGRIITMAFGDGRLYIGGDIRKLDDDDRFGLFALDPATGNFVPGFNGETGGAGGGEINDLELRNGRLYVAGRFESIGGGERRNLAALNPATGVPIDGWAPNPRHVTDFDDVSDLAFHGQRVYVAGRFDTIGGQAHDWVAALDEETGAVDPSFDLDLETNQSQPMRSLDADGSRVYVGGLFSSVNGFPRGNVVAVTANTGDTVVGWNVTASSSVDDIAIAGDRIFLAGFFREINSNDRRGFAAVARTNGALDAWNPLVASPPVFGAIGSGNSIAVSHGRVGMGGNFTRVDGRPRSGLISVATPMPVNSALPVVSGTARDGQTLTCSTGTWSNSPAFAFEWLRDSRPIAGAGASSYTLTGADVGRSVRCRVTASNSDGSAEQLSAAVAVEPPQPPPDPPAGGGTPDPPAGGGAPVTPSQPVGGGQPGGSSPPIGDPGPPRGDATPAAAVARIVRSTATFKKGVVSLKLSCPRGGGKCTGTATVTTADRKRKKLGSARFNIAAGKTVVVKVKLGRGVQAAAKRLKKVRVAVGEASATLPLRVKR
jgi:hypothetical protein